MGRVRAAALAAAAAAVMAVPAHADTQSFGDPTGDTGGYATSGPTVDIVKSTATTASRDRLVHTVTLNGTAPDPSTSPMRGQATPLVLIEKTDGQSRWCDYVVGRTDRGLGVFTCGYMEKAGSVKVTRSGRTVKYVFSRKAIGGLREYQWAVVTRGQSGGTTVEYDRAPDQADSWVTYR